MPAWRKNASPVMAMQNEMNRMVDQFFNDPFTMLSVPTVRNMSEQRAIPLVSEIQQDKIEAKFIKGVLNITLPKTLAATKQTHKIAIKTS